ncbi:hypothetical protein [Aquimarina rubra]|uniref:Uncharacterized protein n=1 Tax=Aquimarina rubra TaxID=1920033 RepID=A0ABW5LHA4_9FLAO
MGLSTGKNYNERYDLPMVYIRYNDEDNNFNIQYQKGQGGETKLVECADNLTENDLNEIRLWLHNTSNRREK